MKFTLNWLKTHLHSDAPLEDLLEALTDLGLEVEGVADPAERLGAFRICKVIEAGPHPDADRLRVCRVATYPGGPGSAPEEVQVVCGAPNARTGLVGVFAPVGTHVPGTGLDLKPGVIRGVESHGMLCSERELELSDDHDGIIDLPEDAPLGARYIDYAERNDPVIEIAITPNRPDALGVRGVARDLAARGLGTLLPREIAPVAGAFPSSITVSIDPEAREGCPYFAGRLVRGVKNGPSPDWLRTRLEAIGLRPISLLVDITNFFTFDLNRPLHVFDAAKVKGNLRVHLAQGGETLTALDDKSYRLEAGMLTISDETGPESIAGIMGGADTGVSDDTVDVFIESAYWDPTTIARAGRALRINSDARYRFERGVDPAFTRDGLEAATAMVLELGGGTASEVVEAGEMPRPARVYDLDPARVERLVGMALPEAEQISALERLGFTVTRGAGRHQVTVPSWRPDVLGEADLVEEVARIASLSRLKGAPLPPRTGVARKVLTDAQRRASTVRRAMAGLGYNECVTYSFIDQEAAALFGGGLDAVRLANPISADMSHMRPDLLPALLRAAARNQARGTADLMLFEVGRVFSGGEPEDNRICATALRVGMDSPRGPHGPSRAVDLFDARADAEMLLKALGAPANLMTMPGAPDWFHPGRAGVLSLGPKTPLAQFGEIHPGVLGALGVKGRAVAVTLMLDALPKSRRKSTARPALDISDLQAVERDFAFVVASDITAEKLLRAAKGADKALIEDVRVFDVFEGGALGEGRKSIAITVRLQPRTATLTDKEIEAVSGKVIAAVTKATGGELRK